MEPVHEWHHCLGCTAVGALSIITQPGLPRCDICGWQHWHEDRQPQWHDIDTMHYSHSGADWDNLMFGMRGARIAVFGHNRFNASLWRTGTIANVRVVVVNRRWRIKEPEWYFKPDLSTLQSHSGTSLWRLLGTQRVFVDAKLYPDKWKVIQQFHAQRDLRCKELVQAYRAALDHVISVSNVVGLMLEYLVWHDKDRDVATRLF